VRRVDERVNTGDALSNIEICNQYSRTRGFSGDRFGKNITATILVACTHVRMYPLLYLWKTDIRRKYHFLMGMFLESVSCIHLVSTSTGTRIYFVIIIDSSTCIMLVDRTFPPDTLSSGCSCGLRLT
jgi:hypothetical protein